MMNLENFSAIMNTLECLELTAADVIDTVTTARAELEQAFEEIRRKSNGGLSL